MKPLLQILFCAAALLLAPLAHAEKPINTTWLGVAIHGTDVVSYFTEGKQVDGNKKFSYDWMGSTWRFVSQEHLDMFKKEPEKYAPQYGGYCAWAVSQGYTADGDPEVWKIVDGKLYLNYDLDVRAKWEKDIPGFIKAADANWPKIIEKK